MKKLLILPFLLIAVTAHSAAPSKSTTFEPQTTIRSDEVNTNFDDLYNYLSLGVDTLRADALDAITEIKSTLRTGSDSTLITGTAGSNTELSIWNSDGDVIGLSEITANTSGMGVPSIRITNFISCTNLGTNASGQIICN